MELRRNIKEQDNSKLIFLLVGVIFLIMGGWMYFDKNDSIRGINMIDLIAVVVLGVIGVYFILKGFNKKASAAYVVVNDNFISLKPSGDSRDKTIHWTEIEHIQKIANSYTLKLKNQSIYTIHTIYYPDDVATDLIRAIEMVAAQKKIQII